MYKELPPLKSILAFSAASNSKSFSQAAEQLCITQSAVSHQIKSLEQFLGQSLFIRKGKSVELTEQGKRYARVVNDSLSEIASATRELTGQLESAIQFGVSSAFAIHRVTPELSNLTEKYPKLDLRLRMLSCSDPITSLDLDVFLYDRPLEHISYQCELLKNESYIAVANPELADKLAHLPVGDWPKQAKFIELQGLDIWREWLLSSGIESIKKETLSFSHTILMMQAALSGQGIALLGESLVKRELATGQLVRLRENSISFDNEGFYFHWHKRRKNDKYVRILKHWLYSLMN